MITVLSVFFVCSILFGVTSMMLLLDVRIRDLNGSQRIIFLVGNLIVFTVNITLSFVFEIEQCMKCYILLVHIPCFLIFRITTRIDPVKIVFALFTSVFLIFPINFILTGLSLTIKQLGTIELLLAGSILYAVMMFIINRFFKTDFNYLIKHYSRLSCIKLCLLPFTYNVSNYWLGMFNYTTTMSLERYYVRILIFTITLTAYILILDIAKSAREKESLKTVQLALSMQLESANRQMSTLQATKERAAIYRHDMRHHFALISRYLDEGDTEKAVEYVRQAQEDLDAITPNVYCRNNTVNLILSSFAAKANANGVNLSVDASLPPSIDLPEIELCTLLSNGLENAINAAARVADEQLRTVRVSCQMHKENLLIFIENSFTGEINMKNGLPQNLHQGHGYGVKSIAMISEKYNGYCSFTAKNELFTLKVVLPPGKKNLTTLSHSVL